MAIAALVLSGCAIADPKTIGRVPALTPVGADLSADQMLARPETYPSQPSIGRYSTWSDRAASLFTASRAVGRGDILTVSIEIDDSASFNNKSDRSRTANRSLGLGGSFASGSASGDLSFSGDVDSDSGFSGSGGTKRSETIDLAIAAVVTDVLANGNLLIRGSQEVRVNAEMRVLIITGIVRPSDIGPENTIPYDRIAEARISYGGQGRITEVQQPPYGQQALDLYLPF
jgi:flagellar L-ring protein precursor FlgH